MQLRCCANIQSSLDIVTVFFDVNSEISFVRTIAALKYCRRCRYTRGCCCCCCCCCRRLCYRC